MPICFVNKCITKNVLKKSKKENLIGKLFVQHSSSNFMAKKGKSNKSMEHAFKVLDLQPVIQCLDPLHTHSVQEINAYVVTLDC